MPPKFGEQQMADSYGEVTLSGLNATQLNTLVSWAKSANFKSITSNGVSVWVVQTNAVAGTALIQFGGSAGSLSRTDIKSAVDTLLGTNASTRALTRAQCRLRTAQDAGQ